MPPPPAPHCASPWVRWQCPGCPGCTAVTSGGSLLRVSGCVHGLSKRLDVQPLVFPEEPLPLSVPGQGVHLKLTEQRDAGRPGGVQGEGHCDELGCADCKCSGSLMRSSRSWLCFGFEVRDSKATAWAFEQELPSARMRAPSSCALGE